VLSVWLALTTWSNLLYLRAALDPPPGRAFVGTFYWIDDFYNYASYVEQAARGQLLLRNKLADSRVGGTRLVNLEWSFLGALSWLLGRRPFLAYRVFGALASLALLAAVERWLSRLGVGAAQRTAALALVGFGGGLGGLLFESTDLPVQRCLDLSIGFFPYLEALLNPHFLAATAGLAWALWCFSELPAPSGPVLGVLLGTLLGFSRPYDLALLLAVRAMAVVASEPRARWLRALAPLAGLAPALAWNLWVFFGSRQFALFRQGSPFPDLLDLLPALGPVGLLAALEWRAPAVDAGRARAHLWAWVSVGLTLILLRPGGFALQLLAGLGLPLLVLAAAALRHLRPAATALAAVCLAGSAVAETGILLEHDPNWFVPRDRLATARALRDLCRPGDRLLAPADISLYAIGLSACHAFVAHPAAPDYPQHEAAVRSFYGALAPAARRALLDREAIAFVVLPGEPQRVVDAWLGAQAPFRVAAAVGSPPTISICVRAGRNDPGPATMYDSAWHE
jgi:hypothetical protein